MVSKFIDIYPFRDRKVEVVQKKKLLTTSPFFESKVEKTWAPKKEKGWTSSWIPIADEIIYHQDKAIIQARTMSYAQTFTWLDAIQKGKNVPAAIPNLSIGIIPVTNDGHVMISRRNKALSHAGGVWNFNGGYMTSLLFAERKECGNPEYAFDPRLFDIRFQAEQRIKNQEFVGLKQEDVTLTQYPSSLVWGYYHSQEMELGWVAFLNKDRKSLLEHVREYEAFKGVKEHSRVDFVPFEELETLIANQVDLLNENPLTYETDDPRKLILLDDNLGELIGGAYKQIMDRELNPSLLWGAYEKAGLMTRIYPDTLREVRAVSSFNEECP